MTVSLKQHRGLRSGTRPVPLAGVLIACFAVLVSTAAARAEPFQSFVAALWPQAHAAGVSRTTFDAAFAGVEPDPEVIAKTQTQAEFHKTLGEYLSTAVSDKRIAMGR